MFLVLSPSWCCWLLHRSCPDPDLSCGVMEELLGFGVLMEGRVGGWRRTEFWGAPGTVGPVMGMALGSMGSVWHCCHFGAGSGSSAVAVGSVWGHPSALWAVSGLGEQSQVRADPPVPCPMVPVSLQQ